MEKTNQIFEEILQKIQELLSGYHCKSEINNGEQDALLYGKFSTVTDRCSIVVHVMNEHYQPVTQGAGPVIRKLETVELRMPSLDLQTQIAAKANCSQADQLQIQKNFLQEAEKIGKEFIKKLNG